MINKKYIALFLILMFFLLCTASQYSIHPPWNQDGNVLYIEKFGKTGYLIMKTFTSTAINAAIDHLGASGGEIYFPEGAYTVNSEITLDNSNITIRGAGGGTILTLSTDNSMIRAPDDVDNIILSDFVLDGDSVAMSANNALIDIEGTENALIDHIHFKNFEEWALYLKLDNNADDFAIIRNCIFQDASDDSSDAIYTDTEVSLGGTYHIYDNEFINCDRAIAGIEGQMIIKGNRFHEGTDIGITTGSEASMTFILGNSFWSNSSHDIYVPYGRGININGNTFYNAGDDPIYIETAYWVNISDNFFEDIENHITAYIYVDSTDYLVINDNNFDHDANSVIHTLHLAGHVTDSVISGNYFDPDPDTAAIYMEATSTGNLIFGNKNTTINCGFGSCTYGAFDGYVYGRTLGAVSSEKSTDYTLTTLDFGKTLVMVDANNNDRTFTLPSMGANEDGAIVYFEKGHTGKLTIDAADTDTIHTSGAGDGVFNAAGQSYATIALEYRHSDTRWYIKQASGTWVPYN